MEVVEEKYYFRKRCIHVIVVGIIVTVGAISLYTFLVSRGVKTTDVNYSTVHKLPDFIIIGVRKGGTRALIDLLNLHPKIVSAKGEVHFFDQKNTTYENKGMSWYISRMPVSTLDKMVVEKTPNYFVTPYVPERIAKSLPHTIKFILIVRDPVIRTISDYTQLDIKRSRKQRKRPLLEKVVFSKNGTILTKNRIIGDSLYDIHYKRWLQYFDSNQILVLDGDEFIKNPIAELVKVETFLKLESYFTPDKVYYNETKGFYCWKGKNLSNRCLGSAKGRNHAEISEDTKAKLKLFYQPHVQTFCKIANVDITMCHQ